MNNAIAKLLSQTYEIEGLLLVVDKHGADTPDMVFDMIRDKASQLHNMVQLLEKPTAPAVQPIPEPIPEPTPEPIPEPIPEPTPEPTPEPIPEPTPESEPDDSLPADDYDKEDTWQHDNGEEFKEILGGFNYEEPVHTPIHQDAAESASEEAPAAIDDDEEEQPPVFIKMKQDEDGEEQDEVRIDEQLQRNLSKNLRKAFTLNDHFRFRRELFANSEAELNDTLNLIETMQSYDEAEEYFYNDMGWDAENEDVAEFMAIIKKHFL